MAEQQSTKSRGKNLVWTLLILASCLMVFLVPATFVLMAIGMAPTWIAAFIERRSLGRVQTTAALNLAGCFPFLGKAWANDSGVMDVLHMLEDVFAWAVMYGSAAGAIIFMWMGPQVAAVYLDYKAARYSSQLTKQRDMLVAEWGDALESKADDVP